MELESIPKGPAGALFTTETKLTVAYEVWLDGLHPDETLRLAFHAASGVRCHDVVVKYLDHIRVRKNGQSFLERLGMLDLPISPLGVERKPVLVTVRLVGFRHLGCEADASIFVKIRGERLLSKSRRTLDDQVLLAEGKDLRSYIPTRGVTGEHRRALLHCPVRLRLTLGLFLVHLGGTLFGDHRDLPTVHIRQLNVRSSEGPLQATGAISGVHVTTKNTRQVAEEGFHIERFTHIATQGLMDEEVIH